MTGSAPTPRPGTLSGESLTYAETLVPEPDVIARARARSADLRARPVSAATGAALRLLAGAVGARTAVEIGTGTGVSGLYLLDGMLPDGVLTSVDIESEHQRVARSAFTEAGIAPNRARLIAGAAMDVLPRLNDASYDLVFCDADKAEYGDYLTQALRLLRPGGVVAIDNALWSGRVADPAQRDPETLAIRAAGSALAENEDMLTAMLPVGDGLLAAVRRR